MSFAKTVSLFLILSSVMPFSGCSLFFGNIRPVEEKSKDYSIDDLAANDSNWTVADYNTDNGGFNHESGRSDIAYQSKKTGAIISVSSACRKNPPNDRISTLQILTQELLLGLSDITARQENEVVVSGAKGLETTVQGRMIHEEVKLRTIVVQIDHCLFDLMYVSRPSEFEKDLVSFTKFVHSIRVGS